MPDELRASDQDRERVVQEIREHFAAGRLTDDELSDRVQAAYDARTASELQSLRADLPQLPATRAEQRAELAQRRADLRRRLLQQSGGALVPFLVCAPELDRVENELSTREDRHRERRGRREHRRRGR